VIEPARPPASEITLDRTADGTLVLRLDGAWSLRTGLPSTAEVEKTLAATPAPRAVAFDTSGLTEWDSSALVVIARIDELCRARRIELRTEGLLEGLRRLLELSLAVPEKADAQTTEERPSWLARLGRAAQGAWRGTHDSLAFLGETALAFGRLARGEMNFRGRDLAIVIEDCGAKALPIVTLINFLVGLIIAFVGAVQLERFGAGIYVADLVAIATVRELGCIMTGIIMAGRTGSGFAAELGTMKVNQEIEAFETMGVSPMDFLVLPRLLALTLMMPLLCLYADLIGMLGGAAVAVGMLDQSAAVYWRHTRDAIDFTDIGLGIGKSVVFGVLVALAGCMRGMTCGRDAAAVGQAATSAVVLGIVWIIASDGIFAVVCNLLGI
jgi:phospholipid/cholesterol/gamma-HCH transport system permease protein